MFLLPPHSNDRGQAEGKGSWVKPNPPIHLFFPQLPKIKVRKTDAQSRVCSDLRQNLNKLDCFVELKPYFNIGKLFNFLNLLSLIYTDNFWSLKSILDIWQMQCNVNAVL